MLRIMNKVMVMMMMIMNFIEDDDDDDDDDDDKRRGTLQEAKVTAPTASLRSPEDRSILLIIIIIT